jgi:hypothetical protein
MRFAAQSGNRLVMVVLLCAMIVLPQSVYSYEHGSEIDQRDLERVLDEIMSRIPAPADGEAMASDYLVKVVYFIPQNRQPQPNGVQHLKEYIEMCQRFFRMEMARNGHIDPLTEQGKTFEFETDADGAPVVHIVNGQHTDAYYRGNDGLDQWGRVLNEVLPVHPVNRSVLLVATECHVMQPDGTIQGGVALGAQYGRTGGWGGIGMIGGNGIWLLPEARFYDTRSYHGLIIPEIGPYPLVRDVSFAWFEGTTIGHVASVAGGAAAHELGHGLGLPHVFVNDNNFNGFLMGNGLRGFRAAFGNFPGERCQLYPAHADWLAPTQYFNPGRPLTDSTAPSQTVRVTTEQPTTAGRRIRIRADANDAGSGLWRSIAILSPPWSTVTSAPFNQSNRAEYFIDSSIVHTDWLKPGSYTVEVLAMDNRGNYRVSSFWSPIPAIMVAQIRYMSSWFNFPPSKWSPFPEMRLAISLTDTASSSTLTPEFEIRPLGTPFSNVSTHVGQPVQYSGSPVTVYLEPSLPDGAYRWQYRINRSGTRSSWVTMGPNDPSILDFGIDTTPPSVPEVNDHGPYTSSTTELTGSWYAEDPESGVRSYSVAVGTTPTDPGSGYVRSWHTHMSSTGTITNLNLQNGVTYYIYARARNWADTTSTAGASQGITVKTSAPAAVTAAEAKALPDGAYVKLESVVASTGKGELDAMFYVQQPDRSSGIQIYYGTGPSNVPSFVAGQAMQVVGTMATRDGERVLTIPAVTLAGTPQSVEPLGMTNQTIGGMGVGLQQGIDGAVGLGNIGLLVRTYGKVTSAGQSEFAICDGSGPVKVLVPAGVAVPGVGDSVMVTGVSSASRTETDWRR